MYKIIGADGKEYGPVSLEQLRQWVTQGRINGDSKVKAETEADWQTLNTLPDLADLFNVPPQFIAPTTAPRTSGLAITSLVLGILGMISCGLAALVGLVCGIIGLRQINRSQGQLTGSGLAIAGIVISSVMILIGLLILPAMLLPALAKAKAKAQSISCMNSAKMIGLGVRLYADDNTNRYPVAATWCDDILPLVGSEQVLQCKADDSGGRSHFAYNAKLSGLELNQIKSPATTVLIFETQGGWNRSGGSELLLTTPRHRDAIVVGFVDGHAELVKTSRLAQLNWEP